MVRQEPINPQRGGRGGSNANLQAPDQPQTPVNQIRLTFQPVCPNTSKLLRQKGRWLGISSNSDQFNHSKKSQSLSTSTVPNAVSPELDFLQLVSVLCQDPCYGGWAKSCMTVYSAKIVPRAYTCSCRTSSAVSTTASGRAACHVTEAAAIMHIHDLVLVIPNWVLVVIHDLRLECGLSLVGAWNNHCDWTSASDCGMETES